MLQIKRLWANKKTGKNHNTYEIVLLEIHNATAMENICKYLFCEEIF